MFVCYQSRVFLIAMVMGECTVLLLQKHFFRSMWYSLVFDYVILKFISIYTELTHSKEQQHHFLCDCHCHGWGYHVDTTKILFWGLCDIIWFFNLIIKFISTHPAWTHSNKQQHHLTSLTSYHLATTKRQDCIRGQTIVVRDILILI